MSNQSAKKGRIPVSQKSTSNSDFAGQNETGFLRVSPELQKEIAEKGLAFRWISLKEFSGSGNFHKNDWMPYKSETLKKQAETFSWGNNPDGYLIRKEMVLAVKPKEMQDAHKAQIRNRTAMQSRSVKAGADALRSTLRDSGAKVYEGYEETSRGGDFDSDDE